MKWEIVCLNKIEGRLGIRSLLMLNRALWVNGFGDFLLKEKHSGEILLGSTMGRKAVDGFPRRLEAALGLAFGRRCLRKLNIRFEMERGDKIRFWEDTWCSEGPLCELFPAMHTVAGARDANISEV